MSRPLSLRDVLGSMAAVAVETQQLWDQQDPLLPRMRLKDWDCLVNLSVASRREVSFTITVEPIHLGFAIAHHRTQNSSSSISFAVTQIPVPSENRVQEDSSCPPVS